MTKIIGISGRKQAGKNTTANYINGEILKKYQMIESFYIDPSGNLVIETQNSSGKSGYGILDVTRKDDTFIEYAERELWPYVKIYHFADPLKELSIALFGLNHKQVYGTNEDKNTVINIDWKDVPFNENKSGLMTSREFLQYFGTTIVRKIYPQAWVNATINSILAEKPEVAIIPDVRFPNEISAIKENNGIILRLTRNIYNSDHESECILDQNNYDWSNFDFIVNNSQGDIGNLCSQLQKLNFIWN